MKNLIKEILMSEIKSMLTSEEVHNESNKVISDYVVGKICMIRTYSAGVHYGKVLRQDGTQVVLEQSRRIFSWSKAATLSQLALEGDASDDTKVAMTIEAPIVLTQAIEIIPMSKDAVSKLGEKTWKM